MTIRFMLDSDDLSALTNHVDYLATYSDLVTNAADFEAMHFPATVVWIDRGLGDPGNKATIMDIETGALSVADAPGLYDRWHAEGREFITGYVNRSNVDAFNAAMGKRQVWRWGATLDGTVHFPNDAPLFAPAIVQCFNADMLGIHADGSLILNDLWRPQVTAATVAVVRSDINAAISDTASVANNLHRMAALLGG